MTENELRINGKSFNETISQIEEFMESDNVHGELFTVLRSARDFMENLNEEIQQYRAIGTIEEFKALKEPQKEVWKSNFNLEQYKLDTDTAWQCGYNKALKDFAERMKELSECGEISVFGWNRIVDEIAEQMKGEV